MGLTIAEAHKQIFKELGPEFADAMLSWHVDGFDKALELLDTAASIDTRYSLAEALLRKRKEQVLHDKEYFLKHIAHNLFTQD